MSNIEPTEHDELITGVPDMTPTPPPVPTQSAEDAAASTPLEKPTEKRGRKIWPPRRATLIAAGVGVLVGLFAAGVPGLLTVSEANSATQAAESERDTIASQIKNTRDTLATTQEQRDRAVSDLADVKALVGDLEAREKAVAEREAAVKATEETIAANSFSGGLHVVGQTVAPGVYRTDGVTNCYYAWKSGTGSDADIIDNNIVSGSATVTLNAGDIFESSRCGTWTKVG